MQEEGPICGYGDTLFFSLAAPRVTRRIHHGRCHQAGSICPTGDGQRKKSTGNRASPGDPSTRQMSHWAAITFNAPTRVSLSKRLGVDRVPFRNSFSHLV